MGLVYHKQRWRTLNTGGNLLYGLNLILRFPCLNCLIHHKQRQRTLNTGGNLLYGLNLVLRLPCLNCFRNRSSCVQNSLMSGICAQKSAMRTLPRIKLNLGSPEGRPHTFKSSLATHDMRFVCDFSIIYGCLAGVQFCRVCWACIRACAANHDNLGTVDVMTVP